MRWCQMSLSRVADAKMSKRVNCRQRALRKRQLYEHRRQVVNAFKNTNNQSISTQKERPTIIVIYER